MVELLLDRKQCDPFEPSHWVRAVQIQYAPSLTRLFVDCLLDDPDCDLVGLCQDLDLQHKIERDIDVNSYVPRTCPRALRVQYRGKHYSAGIFGLYLSDESISDLKCHHGIDPWIELREVFNNEIADWLERHSLAAIPRRQEQQT